MLDAVRAGALFAHDASHEELHRLAVEHFRHLVADDLGIAAALAAHALLRRAGNDFVDTFEMLWQLVAAGMILATAPLLVGRLVALGRVR